MYTDCNCSDINLTAVDGMTIPTGSLVQSNGGDITLDADSDSDSGVVGTFTLNGEINSGAGDIFLSAVDYAAGGAGTMANSTGNAVLNTSAGLGNPTIALGDDAITVTSGSITLCGIGSCDIEIDDATMDAYVVGGTLTIGDATTGRIYLL